MAEGVNFRDLLVVAFKGKVNVKELETRRQTLEAKKDDLQGELAKVQAELKEVDAAILEPIRNAVKAAATLGIEVPVPIYLTRF